MRIHKVKAIVREKLAEYFRMDDIIERLKIQKEGSKEKDVNSFIKSKYKISRTVEGQVIKEINIDNLIEEYKEWKELIKNIFEEVKQNDPIKTKIIDSKLKGATFEKIADEQYIGKETARKYYNEFILEVCIVAIEKKLIKVENC